MMSEKRSTYSDLFPTFGDKFFHPLSCKGFRVRFGEISDYNQDCIACTTDCTAASAKTASQSSAAT